MKDKIKIIQTISALLFFFQFSLAQIDGETYSFISAIKNKALDVQWGKTANGTPLHLWPYNGGLAQKFTLEKAGEGYFYIKSALGKYLHVEGASKKSKIRAVIWQGKGADNTKWKFIDAGNGYKYIQSKLGNNLDVQWAADKDGTPIWMWSPNQGKAQRWKLKEVNPLNYTFLNQPILIKSYESKQYLTVDYFANNKGYGVRLNSKKNNATQLFTISKNTEDGYWINQNDEDKYLHVYHNNPNNGAFISMWPKYVNQDNLKWFFEKQENNIYYIKSALGTYLSVSKGGFGDADPSLYTWEKDRNQAQKWELEIPQFINRSYKLLIEFRTGGDDLRGGSDNLHVVINYKNGKNETFLNVNKGKRWGDNSNSAVWIHPYNQLPFSEINKIELHTTFKGGVFGDNWNLDGVKISKITLSGTPVSYKSWGKIKGGSLLKRFTGDDRILKLDMN